MHKIRNSVALLIVLAALAACAGSSSGLNSDRIERIFGSYGVEIIEQRGDRRVTSLHSGEGGDRITRTYAVVEFLGSPRAAYAREHERIIDGASIGRTFRDAGWTVRKQHLFIGELEIPESYTTIGELMRLRLPETLATHQYLFVISKDGRSFNYATITEIHHPAYLSADDLRTLYGEILFDDSNRDRIHDFIGPPTRK